MTASQPKTLPISSRAANPILSAWALAILCFWLAPAASHGGEVSFALQMNSFRVKANAERLSSRLKQNGYETYTVETAELWYKVRVGPYSTRQEALEAKAALEQNHKMQSILVRTRHAAVESGAPANPVTAAKKPVVKKPAFLKKAFEGDEPEVLAMNPETETGTAPVSQKNTVAQAPAAPAVDTKNHEQAKVEPVPAVPIQESQTSAAPEPVKGEPVEMVKLEPPAPPQAPAAQPPQGSAENSIDVVLTQFLDWLESWQKKQMDAYFSFYSNQFMGDGVPYKDWQKDRSQFLKQNNGIVVEVNDVIIQEKGDTIEMTFIESFKSDSFSDIRQKVLIWKKEGGEWKIVRESSKPA